MAVEVYNRKPDAEDASNQGRRTAAFADMAPVIPLRAGSVLPSTGILGPGTYVGASLVDADLAATGTPVVSGVCSFTGNVIIRGVKFSGTVTIGAQADVLFSACTFLAAITVDSGGKLVCSACRFDGVSAIVNAGSAADCNRVGCRGSSALPGDTGVTITAGI